ncbi:MAG: inorganic phosphate transporter [Candidatus Methanoperedens sp.]|nr:inorganic phosphate transporter [Candidatus Methanoperedens sp.]
MLFLQEFIIFTVVLALFFDFINGFHDSANAISTVVATKVLTPIRAVGMAAVGNLIGPLFFSTAIAATIGKGIIKIELAPNNEVLVVMIFSALVGAIIWDLITWYSGLPTSSSHALVGGLVGAGLAAIGSGSINPSGVEKVVAFMVISPIIGMIAAFSLTVLVIRAFYHVAPSRINKYFRRLQLFSAFFYSVTHGTNDAQKTMGIITVLLVAYGSLTTFAVPLWVILAAHISISLGTFLGGWRIVKTMAQRITKLRPYQGFCAETSGGIVLASMAALGIPVSTTHVISSSIMGVGATDKLSAVRWGIARKIVGAWILTIPMTAIISALTYSIMNALI